MRVSTLCGRAGFGAPGRLPAALWVNRPRRGLFCEQSSLKMVSKSWAFQAEDFEFTLNWKPGRCKTPFKSLLTIADVKGLLESIASGADFEKGRDALKCFIQTRAASCIFLKSTHAKKILGSRRYPAVHVDEKNRSKKLEGIHRFLLVCRDGPAPTDKPLALHRPCCPSHCINPAHLRWGSHQDNADDRQKKMATCKRPRPRKRMFTHVKRQLRQQPAAQSPSSNSIKPTRSCRCAARPSVR